MTESKYLTFIAHFSLNVGIAPAAGCQGACVTPLNAGGRLGTAGDD